MEAEESKGKQQDDAVDIPVLGAAPQGDGAAACVPRRMYPHLSPCGYR